MPLFQPKGDRSQRSIIAALAASSEYGALLSYDELIRALGIDDDDNPRPIVRSAVTAARPLILRDHGRVLIADRGRGYRIGQPGELAGVAQAYRMSADRQLSRALDIVTHGDTASMSDVEYQRFAATRTVIVGLHRRMTAVEDRLERMEKALFGDGEPTSRVAGEVIERHDARLDAPQGGVRDSIFR
jgi:hypothetical protein